MIQLNRVMTAVVAGVLVVGHSANAQYGERTGTTPRRPISENAGTVEFEVEKPKNSAASENSNANISPTAHAMHETRVRPTASIVARVDDIVILLEEAVGMVRPRLLDAKAKLSPEKYDEVERELLKGATNYLIDRAILLLELQGMLKKNGADKNALDRIRKMAVKDFESYLTKVANDAKPRMTREEVIAQIEKEGSTVNDLRRNFIDSIISNQYLEQVCKKDTRDPTREDLYKYYQSNIKEFGQEAGAVWRQIEVKKATGQEKAYDKIREIEQRLRNGEDFATLAKQFSDGPTAQAGGIWSLTSRGSYSDEIVDNAIFTIPVGQASQIIDGRDGYHIVRVEKRSNGDPKPFSEVQEVIRKKIVATEKSAIRAEKMKELRRKHYVENIFERPDVRTATSLEKPIR